MKQVKINYRNYEDVTTWSLRKKGIDKCLLEITTAKRSVCYQISTDTRHPNIGVLIRDLRTFINQNDRIKIEEYLERLYIYVRAPYVQNTLQYTATKI